MRADCEHLLSSVQGTAEQAEQISSKVRAIDTVKRRVQHTLSEVGLILDRTNCIHGVQQAMENEDYASAAQYISTFMSLEAKLAASGAAAHADDMAQAAEQKAVLQAAKTKLEAVVEAQFTAAVARRDQPEVVKFTRLFKLLDRAEEGLRRFIDYLKLMVSARARTEFHQLSEQLDGTSAPRAGGRGGGQAGQQQAPQRGDFVAALTSLFKDVAMALEEHEAMVTETFGKHALVDVAAGLHVSAPCMRTPLCPLVGLLRVAPTAEGLWKGGAAGGTWESGDCGRSEDLLLCFWGPVQRLQTPQLLSRINAPTMTNPAVRTAHVAAPPTATPCAH